MMEHPCCSKRYGTKNPYSQSSKFSKKLLSTPKMVSDMDEMVAHIGEEVKSGFSDDIL